ncbi:MAG: hypothetical protein AAF500_16420 [Myxococcota bacterium]
MGNEAAEEALRVARDFRGAILALQIMVEHADSELSEFYRTGFSFVERETLRRAVDFNVVLAGSISLDPEMVAAAGLDGADVHGILEKGSAIRRLSVDLDEALAVLDRRVLAHPDLASLREQYAAHWEAAQ